VQHRYVLRLARIKRANAFDIHEMHFFQIQTYTWSATFDLGPDLIDMLGSKLPAQPNSRLALTRNPFNPQPHRFPAPEHSCDCNDWAIHNSLKRWDLTVPRILNFEEFLYEREKVVDCRVAAVESASLINSFGEICQNACRIDQSRIQVQAKGLLHMAGKCFHINVE
jgi:hypothetical protein